MLTTFQILAIARKHLNNGASMASSAQVCMDDAEKLAGNGEFGYAREWAFRSLSYSVGIFHADYQAVAKAVLANKKAVAA